MKKRNPMNLRSSFLGVLLVMAFMIIGAHQASAQYLPVEDALNRLGTEIMVIHNEVVQNPTSGLGGIEVDASDSQALQKLYYEGVAFEIKNSLNIQEAIDTNHAVFLEKFSSVATSADQYRTEVENLLSE